MVRKNSFVILFQGRTGSTYLTEGVASHPDVRAVGEKFKGLGRSKGAEAQIEGMRHFLEAASDRDETARGFKIKLRDVIDHEGFGVLLKEFDTSIVMLTRRNHVKHAVSHFTAVQLYESTGDWNRYDDSGKPQRISIDPDDFTGWLAKSEERRQALRRYVTDLELPTLFLQYEYLLTDPADVFDSVFHFIGVDPKPLEGRTRKNTSDDLREVLENFDELLDRCRGTKYEAMFHEVLTPTPA